MKIVIIAAMAANRVIGRQGDIPWHIPEELQWFKSVTMGHVLIMGRKTHESIGRPLPGRETIVISRDAGRVFTGCTRAGSLDEALARCAGRERVLIAGGAQIYALALPVTDTILLSVLDQEVEGDAFFPIISPEDFIETARTPIPGLPPYTRVVFERRR